MTAPLRTPAGGGAAPALPPHGGDVWAYRAAYGREPLDFSANGNPLGPSPAALAAARAALAASGRYPDPVCRELRGALARACGVEEGSVICGAGASDVIWRLAAALAPRRALLCAPTFSEYESALVAHGCDVRRHALVREEGFALTPRICEDIAPGTDVVFLCEPNNPTGLASPRALVECVLARCDEVGALLVVDECFGGFLPDPAAHTMQGLVEAHPRLFVLGAATKLYGLAGLRLGWGLCSDHALLARMRACGPAWPVSSVAQAAGVAALADADFLRATRELVARERPRLAAGLAALGCHVLPGQANYLFFRAPVPDLCARLARRGVMARDCANYPGLRPGDCRVAVRRPEENDVLLAAVAAACGEGGCDVREG